MQRGDVRYKMELLRSWSRRRRLLPQPEVELNRAVSWSGAYYCAVIGLFNRKCRSRSCCSTRGVWPERSREASHNSRSAPHAKRLQRLTLEPAGNTLRIMTTVQPPIDLENWIEENRGKFKPPVSNRYLYDGRDFFVMVIKGPNARNDFHLVDSEEYFYQLKGDIKVRIREGDRIVDHIVRQGETFFIPPNVPHSPQRPPDTIGVVVERRRPPGEKEHVIFYCENCGALVQDIHFDCADIVEHFSQAMLDFWNDDARRTCKKCGKKVEKPEPMKPF